TVSYYLFFFTRCVPLRDLPSFPTRRSSDLPAVARAARRAARRARPRRQGAAVAAAAARACPALGAAQRRPRARAHERRRAARRRSEEHTSELQSLTNLVCRLLLEKQNQYT